MKFLTEPALLIDGVLVVADLHIGMEQEIGDSGVTVPSQIESIKERLLTLIKQNRAKHLVILGDVKHNVPQMNWTELRELPVMLNELAKKVKVSIVKGNHDGGIERVARNADVYEPDGFALGEYAFVHGQAWPKPELLSCKTLIMSHAHPVVEFFSQGTRMTEHCWLRCRVNAAAFEKKLKVKCNLEEAVVMPVFNRLIGGVAVNSERFKPIGPVLKSVDWQDADVFLTDGTYLGKTKEIK